MQNWNVYKGPRKTCNFFSFWAKLIGQLILDGNGQGIARDIKKNNFHFQNATKKYNKVGTIYKIGTFQLFKLTKNGNKVKKSYENGNNFFNIPSHPLPITVRNSLTIQFFQKIHDSVYFQTKTKMQNWREGSFQLFKLSELCYHF